MLREAREAAGSGGTRIWSIEPIPFDGRLVQASGLDRVMASGALHDAAEMARHVPTVMVFAPSSGGLSHAPGEDTPEADLEQAIAAFGRLAARVIAGDAP
jgi:N-carbamoyl-L-amino-acid hydrolase